jgi:hypothetical protein
VGGLVGGEVGGTVGGELPAGVYGSTPLYWANDL